MKRAVILLTLTAAGAAVPAIALARARRVHPSLAVLSEKVRGKSVTFTLDVRFTVPHGVAPRSACKGKVTVSAKPKKSAHWSGRFANKNGICDAHVKGRLPKAAEGSKVRFKVAFAGNSAIAAFASSKRVSLTNPVVGGPATSSSPSWTASSRTPSRSAT